MDPDRLKLASLKLFVTVEHPCGYLPERAAQNLVTDPDMLDQKVYTQLAGLGFRRSGGYVYRPHCIGCNACLSLRIPVARFQPSRSQQRAWKKNRDLAVRPMECSFNPEHYALFTRYLKTRHRDGGMDETTPHNYMTFISSTWSHTKLYEFRHNRVLLAVAVVDHLSDSLSAVYTFFEPRQPERSLGTHTILWQIAEAKRLGLKWVYLGYWIDQSEKMAYKANFRPHEIFAAGRWVEGS